MRLSNDRRWPIRLDCGELGSFELDATEARTLATDIIDALERIQQRTRP